MPIEIYKRIKQNSGQFKKGKNPWNKGKKNSQVAWNKGKIGIYSEETIKKMSKARIGKKILLNSGENHYRWKGGRVSLNMQVRKSLKTRQWRSDIFTRDNFTCIVCGKHGGELQADHIKSFSIIMEENKIMSLLEAENCEELWNLNNGRTLCKQCHYKTHNYGGFSRKKKKFGLGE